MQVTYTSLFPQDMIQDIYIYSLHWNTMHKCIGAISVMCAWPVLAL